MKSKHDTKKPPVIRGSIMDELFMSNELRVFKAVYEAESFTGAALALGVSQPAVSLKIVKVEKIMGVRLMTRTKTGCEPTYAGDVLMELIEGLEEFVRASEEYRRHKLSSADNPNKPRAYVFSSLGRTAKKVALSSVLKDLAEGDNTALSLKAGVDVNDGRLFTKNGTPLDPNNT